MEIAFAVMGGVVAIAGVLVLAQVIAGGIVEKRGISHVDGLLKAMNSPTHVARYVNEDGELMEERRWMDLLTMQEYIVGVKV